MWDGYRTPRWRRLREKILRRDGYMSVIARRYGQSVKANLVHHVWPAEDFPEYAWAPWNLVSITLEEHALLHNLDGSLTPQGRALQARYRPPHPRP